MIVLTSGSHAPAAIAAARAGIHVFVEKPMCLNLDEGRAMLERRERRGRAADGRDDEALRPRVRAPARGAPRRRRAAPRPGDDARVAVAAVPGELRAGAAGGRAGRLLAALKAEDERRLSAALPDADENTRYCYRWMLLDNLVHELNALRGALGEPELVKYAELSPQARQPEPRVRRRRLPPLVGRPAGDGALPPGVCVLRRSTRGRP